MSVSGEFGIEVEVLIISKCQAAQLTVRVGRGAICKRRRTQEVRGEDEIEKA